MQETQETLVQSLGWEDPLEEDMAIDSSILAWRISWTEEPWGPQSIGSQRVRHNWSSLARTQAHKVLFPLFTHSPSPPTCNISETGTHDNIWHLVGGLINICWIGMSIHHPSILCFPQYLPFPYTPHPTSHQIFISFSISFLMQRDMKNYVSSTSFG